MFPVSFDLSQLLRSSSTCFNVTTSIKTGSSCGLTGGLDSIGFSENRSAKWGKMRSICH